MLIKNKFEKLLLIISSFFLGIIIILGIKTKEVNKKIQDVKDQLAALPSSDVMVENQKAINYTREKIIDIVTKSPVQDITTNTTTKTVIPGKIVPVTVTKKSGNSNSSSSSSSSSKTTKTS